MSQTNGPAKVIVTSSVLPTGAAQDGTDISSPTAMPAGGSGARGWLSAVWTKLNGTLTVAFATAQHVIVDTAPTTAVTGTFWQATQPVSLATNTPDVTDRAARLLGHVTVDSSPAVTGTVSVSNFPATQPVSLATNTPDVTDRSARLLGHVTVDSAPTTAITAASLPLPTGAAADATLTGGTQKAIMRGGAKGTTTAADLTSTAVDANTQALHTSVTNFPAVQAVSLATNTPDVTDRSGRLLGHVTVDSAPTTTVTGSVAVTGNPATNVAQVAGAVPSATNPLPVRLTNGSVFTDARTPIVLSASGVASVTSVALMTLNIYKAGVVSSGTTYTVTAGKTFRITAIQFGVRFATPSTTVTFASTTFVLRFVTTGTAVVTSPILHQDSKLAASNVPTPNSDLSIPDGIDLPAGYNFGITHLASAATLLEDVLIVGYEF